MQIIESPSPNHGPRPAGASVDLLVIHGTAGTDAGDLSWCRSPQAGVSYHYLILRDGTVHRLVPEDRRAWHAGASAWSGRPNCNDFSIGIGLSNKGPGEPYPEAQFRAAIELVRDIMQRRRIPPSCVAGHADISPGRKSDPWGHWDWHRFLAALEARP